MPVIEGHQLVLDEHLRCGDDRGVDEAELEVAVLGDQLTSSLQPALRQVEQLEGACFEIDEQGRESIGPGSEQVLDLDEHADGDDSGLLGFSKQVGAALMVRIGGVEECDQRAGIEDQRH